jgi:hypothetical protein
MQAYKLKGKIDQDGNLVLIEQPSLPSGDVEVIVLHSAAQSQTAVPSIKSEKTTVKAFQDLFKHTEPAPVDFDPDQVRWEALKEKHSL